MIKSMTGFASLTHEDDRATTPPDRGTPTDAGKTSGGGSQGHKQPKEVTDAAPIRNNPD